MKCSNWFPVILITAVTAAAAQMPSAPMPSAPAPADRSEAGVPTSVGPAKIGVIAFQAAVTSTNEFQRSFLDIQKKFTPKRQVLKTMSDQIDSLTKELEATDSKLTEQQKAARAHELDDKKKQFEREQQDDQTDFTQQMQDLFQQTASKVEDVLTAYAQQHGYTVVLDVGSSQDNPVMYVGSPSMNLTQEVVAAYNQKSGVPPPAPSAETPARGPQAPKAPAAKPGSKPPSQ